MEKSIAEKNIQRSKRASIREKCPLYKSTSASIVEIRRSGSSFLEISRESAIGAKSAGKPTPRPIFVIFEPSIFPKEIPIEPLITAKRETRYSGAEVANPTMTIPMIRGEMRAYTAIVVAPMINLSADHIRSMNPPIRHKT